jgi:N-acetyl-anhydromuramyl-L-alanine amidase AmpD
VKNRRAWNANAAAWRRRVRIEQTMCPIIQKNFPNSHCGYSDLQLSKRRKPAPD